MPENVHSESLPAYIEGNCSFGACNAHPSPDPKKDTHAMAQAIDKHRFRRMKTKAKFRTKNKHRKHRGSKTQT